MQREEPGQMPGNKRSKISELAVVTLTMPVQLLRLVAGAALSRKGCLTAVCQLRWNRLWLMQGTGPSWRDRE